MEPLLGGQHAGFEQDAGFEAWDPMAHMYVFKPGNGGDVLFCFVGMPGRRASELASSAGGL